MTPATAMLAAWVAWVVSWLAAALWSDQTISRPGVGHQVVYRLVTAAGAALLFGGFRVPANVVLWRLAAGAAWAMVGLAIAGFLFTWWARIHIGPLWSGAVTRKAAHRLIESGPYRLVRHPIYTGLIVATSATAAQRGTLVGCLGAAAITAGLFIKARIEEQFLRDELGADEYDAYARRVPMLVPCCRRPSRGAAGILVGLALAGALIARRSSLPRACLLAMLSRRDGARVAAHAQPRRGGRKRDRSGALRRARPDPPQELFDADAYDGVDAQHFTTVVDDGFSKRIEEALRRLH